MCLEATWCLSFTTNNCVSLNEMFTYYMCQNHHHSSNIEEWFLTGYKSSLSQISHEILERLAKFYTDSTSNVYYSHVRQVVTLDCDGLHQPLSHSLPILLQNPALVTTCQVQDSKRVLEQALLHISVQLCVCVVTGRVVYLADRQVKALVTSSVCY